MNNEKDLVFSIPAEISILPESELRFEGKNSFITPAKLRVFYKGTTPDGRTFTDEFSENAIKTLPQTPVVAYYSEEDEDFIGHNGEQYVYGYVPEVGIVNFEEIDGQTWAVTDIALFTGRDDKIGEVARKIIGKQHSLELDRNTAKYKIIKDANGKFQEMIFTEGNIVGLSVLGDNQTPGFTGSEFFTQQEETIQDLIQRFTDIKEELHVNNFIELFSNENDNGGVEMEFSTETILAMNNFMKETYDEAMQKVYEAIVKEFGEYVYVVQMSDSAAVFVDYADGGKYYRVDYTSSEEGFTFGEKVDVKPRFLTEDEINSTFEAVEKNSELTIQIDAANAAIATMSANTTEGMAAFTSGNAEFSSATWYFDGDLTTLTDTPTLNYSFSDTDSLEWNIWTPTVTETEAPTGVTISEEEFAQMKIDKEEAELYRKEKKEAMIDKYAKFLSEEEMKNYKDSIGKYTLDNLEKELSFQAMQKVLIEQQEEEKAGKFKATKILGPNGETVKSENDKTKELIDRYK